MFVKSGCGCEDDDDDDDDDELMVRWDVRMMQMLDAASVERNVCAARAVKLCQMSPRSNSMSVVGYIGRVVASSSKLQ